MAIKERSAGYLNKQLTVIVTAATKLSDLLHTHLCECLYHVANKGNGDTTVLQNTLNMLPASQRTATIRAWIGKFSPILGRNDKENPGKFKLTMKEGWSELPNKGFDLEGAEATPYWELGPEANPRDVTLENLIQVILGLSKRIDKAVEEGRFQGDATVAQAAISPVVQLAQEQLRLAEEGKIVPFKPIGDAAKAKQDRLIKGSRTNSKARDVQADMKKAVNA